MLRFVWGGHLLTFVSAIEVTISLVVPSVLGNLVSLSIEQDRWIDWAGTTEPNTFFNNVLDNLHCSFPENRCRL